MNEDTILDLKKRVAKLEKLVAVLYEVLEKHHWKLRETILTMARQEPEDDGC